MADMNDGIEIKKFEFRSNSGYTTIHGKMWIPDKDVKVKGVLQISHGMSEYIDRYDDFAKYLAKRGIAVIGNDHMGHGDSINSKDDFGFFAPLKQCKKAGKEAGLKKDDYGLSALTVKDLYEVTKIAKKEYPDVPFFMLGHSMGSFLARRYMMEHNDELDGIIIMGTGNQPKLLLSTAICVSTIIRVLRGERRRSMFFYFLMFGSYNKRITDSKNPYAWITTDEEKLASYDNDERSGFMFTMNGINALLSTIKFIEKKKNIAKIPKDIKMLFVSGTEDPVGEYGVRVREVYDQYKAHGVKDINIKMYEGCRHEILNEKIRPEVYEDLAGWLEARIK